MTGRAMRVLGTVALVAGCGRGDARTDTAAAADSAVQAARAAVDSSVPLPDTLVPTAQRDSAATGRGPAAVPAEASSKPSATQPAKAPARPSPTGSAPQRGATPATTPRPATTPSTPARQGAMSNDTLRGKPAVVGSMPFTQVVLRPAAGGAVTITGPLAREIGRASGADVWVRGTRNERGFEASDYRVRTVDGVAALDGVLVVDGENTYLRLADGSRRALRAAPAALRAEAGARVWVTGGLDQPVAAFGILRPRD